MPELPIGVETFSKSYLARILIRVPSLDGSWRVMGGPVQINLGITYNGEQLDTDFGTVLRTKQDPYTLVRLGASWRLNDSTELYGRIENMTDEDYQEVIGFDGGPRIAYIGVRFKESSGD